MSRNSKIVIGQGVDPLSFKLPDYLDSITRQIPHRSEFLRRSAALGLILYTERLVNGRHIARMVQEGLLDPEDILMLVRANRLTVGSVQRILKLGIIEGEKRSRLSSGLAALL